MAPGGGAAAVAKEVGVAACGGSIVDAGFNGFEVVKTRLQLETPGASFWRGARRVIAEHSLLSVWGAGLTATWLRGLLYTGGRVGMYPTVRDAVRGAAGGGGAGGAVATGAAAGAATGCAASVLCCPIDVVRVRLMADLGKTPRYCGTLRALLAVGREEGLARGLWRGGGVCAARAAAISGTQLTTYDNVKRAVRTRIGTGVEGPPLHFAASALSGCVAQCAGMPFDVLKTRVMNARGALTARAALRALLRDDGVLSLWRGLSPAMLRQAGIMAVQMPLLEQLRRLAGLGYYAQ